MTMSKFNRQWYESGRNARFKAELASLRTGHPVILPESSHNATAHAYWRTGWNSITREELHNLHNSDNSPTPERLSSAQHINDIRQRLGDHR